MYTQSNYPKDSQAKELVQAVEKVELLNVFSHLIRGQGRVVAAKNMRTELKRAFPGIKFSVTGSSFAGGCSIHVKWTDGPTAKQVDAIIDKYQYGHFDGMTDYYDYNDSVFCEVFGSTKYTSSSRQYSDEFIARGIAKIVEEFGGCEPITVAEYRQGGAHYWKHSGGCELGRELNVLFSNTEGFQNV